MNVYKQGRRRKLLTVHLHYNNPTLLEERASVWIHLPVYIARFSVLSTSCERLFLDVLAGWRLHGPGYKQVITQKRTKTTIIPQLKIKSQNDKCVTPIDLYAQKIIDMGSCWTNDYSMLKSTSNDLLARVKIAKIQQHFVVNTKVSLHNLLAKLQLQFKRRHTLVKNRI